MKEYLSLKSLVEVSGIAIDAAKMIVADTVEWIDTKLANALNEDK